MKELEPNPQMDSVIYSELPITLCSEDYFAYRVSSQNASDIKFKRQYLPHRDKNKKQKINTKTCF